MSETWYRLSPLWAVNPIEPVQVTNVTSHTVTVDGRRRNRISGYERYFRTAEECRSHAIMVAETEVAQAAVQMSQAQAALGKARGIQI